MQASSFESDAELTAEEARSEKKGTARRDLLVAILITLGLYFVGSYLDLNEAWVEISKRPAGATSDADQAAGEELLSSASERARSVG